jgi:DNA sulfur modification protein DndC
MFFKASVGQLYREDQRPWLVGFSGGKDSTMLASLIFDVVLSIPAERRKKPISVLCTDTRVEIPAIAEMIEGALDRMRKCSQQHGLNIETNLLKPGNRFGSTLSAVDILPPTARSAGARSA